MNFFFKSENPMQLPPPHPLGADDRQQSAGLQQRALTGNRSRTGADLRVGYHGKCCPRSWEVKSTSGPSATFNPLQPRGLQDKIKRRTKKKTVAVLINSLIETFSSHYRNCFHISWKTNLFFLRARNCRNFGREWLFSDNKGFSTTRWSKSDASLGQT